VLANLTAGAMNEFEAMLLSALIEGPVAFTLVYFTRWPSRGPQHVGLAQMLATAVTHPQLWAAFPSLLERFGYDGAAVVGEAIVVVVEAAFVAWATGLSPARALIVSFCANGASVIVGLVFFA